MVLAGISRLLARARKQVLAANYADAAHFSIITRNALPELRTLTIAPDEVHSDYIDVRYNHSQRKLHVEFIQDTHVTFVFRETDILVLSEEPFVVNAFKEKLRVAIQTTRAARTVAVPAHSPSHV